MGRVMTKEMVSSPCPSLLAQGCQLAFQTRAASGQAEAARKVCLGREQSCGPGPGLGLLPCVFLSSRWSPGGRSPDLRKRAVWRRN